MTCQECKRSFSDELIQPLYYKGTYTPMCPLCALAITNKIHGMNRKKFAGTMANELLEQAKEEVKNG